ncbi:MAG: STAS domain-containing protein [Actinobacteria bacterium]|nr:STAS domain-containing protein [Actinomycetota bacterium]
MIQFEFEEHSADDPQVVVLALTGELDLTNAQELGERLESVVSTGSSSLVLDLTRVAFIDSAALHVLFRGARGLSKERFGLVIEPASAISRTFEIVGLDAVATVGGSVHDVMATLSSG